MALLCSGQSSTITGTLAGQVVMEGFVRLRISPVLRRAVTRGLAIVPAVLVLALVGDGGVMPLLIASQVVLSLQLPFAIVPLVRFTSSNPIMGCYANRAPIKLLAGLCALIVSGANAALVARLVADWHERSPALAYAFGGVACAALVLLAWISMAPLREARPEDRDTKALEEAASVRG